MSECNTKILMPKNSQVWHNHGKCNELLLSNLQNTSWNAFNFYYLIQHSQDLSYFDLHLRPFNFSVSGQIASAYRCVSPTFCPVKLCYKFWAHFWQYWCAIRHILSGFWRKLELYSFKVKTFNSKMTENWLFSHMISFFTQPYIFWPKVNIKPKKIK